MINWQDGGRKNWGLIHQYIYLLPLKYFFQKIIVSESKKKNEKNEEKRELDILK